MRAKTLATLALLCGLGSGPALAQDYGPYGYDGYGFDWDGFYAGVYGGGVPKSEPSYNAGIFSGVNATYGSLLLGAEAQLGLDIDDTFTLDALVLAKGGMTFGDATAYALGGAGMVQGGAGLAVGAGLDYGVTDYLSLRAQGLGTAPWADMPNEFRLSAGLAFHM